MTKRWGRRRSKMQRSEEGSVRRRKSISRGSGSSLEAAGGWPLHKCLLTEEWRDEKTITQILVSRKSSGRIAIASFLVDLGCLGVKSAFGRIVDRREYTRLRRQMASHQGMIEVDLNLVAKIIQEAIDYAGELGFRPDPDYRDAMLVLGDADPDACDVEIPLGGEDGKPFYIAGPHDNVDQIMDTLMNKLGPNGFHYVVPMRAPEDWQAHT